MPTSKFFVKITLETVANTDDPNAGPKYEHKYWVYQEGKSAPEGGPFDTEKPAIELMEQLENNYQKSLKAGAPTSDAAEGTEASVEGKRFGKWNKETYDRFKNGADTAEPSQQSTSDNKFKS